MAHQLPREVRAFSFFLVLEIHVDVAAGRRLPCDGLGPSRDVIARVAFVAQPEVRVVGGHADRRRQLLAVGDAQRQVPRCQPRKDLLVQPRHMTELESRAHLRRQLREERVEDRQILLQVRRQLEQERAELVAERAGDLAEYADALAVTACRKPSDQRTFALQGQIQVLYPARKLVVVKHEEIKGFMPAMTMPYEVREAQALDGLAAGDLIKASLVVFSNGAYLTGI